MAAVWYEPDEVWPEHGKAYWRDALLKYRGAGWRLKYIDAPHRFGVLQCPCGQHTDTVDKTADGGDYYASLATTRIRACEKARGVDSVSTKLDQATRLVTNAELLMSQAERGLEHLERYDHLAGLLDQSLNDDEADKVEGEVLAAEDTAIEARALAESLVDELSELEDEKLSADAVAEDIAGASNELSRAQQILRRVRPGKADAVRRRADGVRSRVGPATVRLAAWRSRSRT